MMRVLDRVWSIFSTFKFGSMNVWQGVWNVLQAIGVGFRKRLTQRDRRRLGDEEDSFGHTDSDSPHTPSTSSSGEWSTLPNARSSCNGSTYYREEDSALEPQVARDEDEPDDEFFSREPELEEVVCEHLPLGPTQAERVFLDRINSCDEEELISACNRMNFEITACTQAIADEWSQTVSEHEESLAHDPPNVSPEVRYAVGDEILQRIQDARRPDSSYDLEGTVDFALRAWTICCISTYISKPFLGVVESLAVLHEIAQVIAAKDEPVARIWIQQIYNVLRGPEERFPESKISVDEVFTRLADTYAAHGQLSVALRWRSLAYEVVSKESYFIYKDMRTKLLRGMGEILRFAEGRDDPTRIVLEDFPNDDHVACLLEPMKHLTEMLYTGFMTAIYEVRFERPGADFDLHRMEAWESDGVQAGSAQAIVCTTELGLVKSSEQRIIEDRTFYGKGDARKSSVLVKPIVLL